MAKVVRVARREPTLHVHEVRDDLALEFGAERRLMDLRVVDKQQTLQHLRFMLYVRVHVACEVNRIMRAVTRGKG